MSADKEKKPVIESRKTGDVVAEGATHTVGPASRTEGEAMPKVQPDLSGVLGQMVWLMVQSSQHKNLCLADLEWRVVPAIVHRQFRIWRHNGLPVAFASWAFLTEESEKRFSDGAPKLSPTEWQEGGRLWVVDLVAPFGGEKGFVKDLSRKTFPKRDLKILTKDKQEKRSHIVQWQGGTVNEEWNQYGI